MEIANRSTYRGQVTRLVNAANEYLQSNESRPTAENVDSWDNIVEDLSVFLQRLKTAHESLNKTNNETRALIKVEDFPKESETIAEYEDKAVGAIERLTQRLHKVRRMQDQLMNSNSSTRLNASNEKSSAVKMPKLPLKIFSGNHNDWLPYWEQFRRIVHENAALSGTDKFVYLESTLKGRAAATIAGLSPIASNYDGAIALLKEEFGNYEKIIDKNMQQLMGMPALTSKTDAKGLRRLYNTVMTCIRSLNSMGIPSGQYSIMLKSKLLRCLPADLRVSFHRLHPEESIEEKGELSEAESTASVADSTSSFVCGDAQTKRLLRFIKREAESLESALDEQESHKQSKHFPTAAGLFTTNTTNSCFFCKSTRHNTRDCDGPHTLTQRKEMLKGDNRCFRCTGRGHSSKRCFDRRLRCKKCKGCHAQSVCDPNYSRSKETMSSLSTETSMKRNNEANSSATLCAASAVRHLSNVLLQTACVFAMDEERLKSVYMRIILDGGSQLSYIKESVAERLNLPVIRTQKLSIIPFGTQKRTPMKFCNCVRLCLKSQHNSDMVVLDAVVVPEICFDVLTIPSVSEPKFSKFLLADSRPFSFNPDEGIGLLIGADNYWRTLTGDFERISESLTAINTVFGWTLHGPAPIDAENFYSGLTAVSFQVSAVNDFPVEKFWDLDSLGIRNHADEAEDFTENYAEKFILKNGNRYEVLLPWKDNNSTLDDNKIGAYIRFKTLTKNLCRVPSKLLKYDEAIREFISSGFAEKVDHESTSKRCYYLPHRAVYREDKVTTKIRIVFDASAHAERCQSLNDQLLTGTNLLPDVLKILLNFRLGCIGLIADIEKAFLQIMLNEVDRDVHRFYWYADKIESAENLPPLQIYRMTRVTFGVTSSPFLLSVTLQKHFDEEKNSYPKTTALLKESIYMDDLVCSVNTIEEALKVHQEAKTILKNASMNLRKWNSSYPTMRAEILKSENPPDLQKVLGLLWFVHTDELCVDIVPVEEFLATNANASKRSLLQVISRFYDPLGLLGPFIVKLKILFQQVWKQKLDWDEGFLGEVLTNWNGYCKDVVNLKCFSVPRCVWSQITPVNYELHLFADASIHAYGAAAYVKTTDEDSKSMVRLLCAKNRVAPLKLHKEADLTLPKLELTAALIAARLSSYIMKGCTISFERVVFWTDSKIALHWILGDISKWKPYVVHRVQEIKALTRNFQWRHCPGKDNPADLLTRGISAKILLHSEIWMHGPQWLANPYENLPQDESHMEFPGLVVALQISSNIDSSSSAEEISRAEKYWLRYAQRKEYGKEINSLRKGNPIEKTSPILMLNPKLDEDGILRLNSRLPATQDNYYNAYPVILPKRNVVSKLIVKDVHLRMKHSGTNAVLTELRNKFWIIQARQLVKSVINKCFTCKRLKVGPASQPFAPLPNDRIQTVRPFYTTGVDFAGPLYVKEDSKDELTKKVYILLFTCGTIRAIHLELVRDLSTESCLMAIRRFIGRRGKPKVIYSDNAKTFKRAAKEFLELNSIIKNEMIQGFLSNEGIKWKFIVERAPWWGGFYERLVRSVKDILKITIGRSTLNFDELQTLLIEAEYVINSRPLTYVASDEVDFSPLTPSQFLLGTSTTAPTTTVAETWFSVGCQQIRQLWNERLRSLKFFWERWRKEYLLQLRSLHHGKPEASTRFRENDVVLLRDDSRPRILWKLAKVKEVYPGRDGKIRSCRLILPHGVELRRPVQFLYPLELNSGDLPAGEDVVKTGHN